MGAGELQRIARETLLGLTPPDSIGDFLGERVAEDGVCTLTFAARLSGYPGWHWSVSLVELEGLEPTVLESELLPGEGALLAPDWVPWSQRLEEYRAAQAAAGELDELDDESEDDEPDDVAAELDEADVDDVDYDEDLEVEAEVDYADDEASALFAVGEDEEDEAEAESDDGGPEPADEPRLDDR